MSVSLLGAWDTRFALPPGVNGEVMCAVTMGNDLYIGGRFTRAGGLDTGGIARWDGARWWLVGDGVDGNVGALFVHGNSLYVGGQFRTLGSVSATNIARWTRTGWKSLGDGIPTAGPGNNDQYVAAIAARGRDVYVGGSFTEAGGVSATNVAKWDGRQWSALGDGIGRSTGYASVFGRVEALEWCRGSLFAGGIFDRAGDTAVKNLARWDGHKWRDAGAGVQGGNIGLIVDGGETHYGIVNALAKQGTDLLVGGDFTQAGDVAATNLVRWNGRRWLRVGGGVQGGGVSAICVRGLEVFVAGGFERAGKVAANNVARWDGRRWKAFDSGVRGYASALAVRGKRLYAGGYFGLAGGVPAAFVAQWNRGDWSALNNRIAPGVVPPLAPPYWPPPTNALIGEVRAIAARGSNVYVGGQLFSAGLVPVNNVAHWNGSRWSDMGGGIPNGTVRHIAVDGSNVYMAGTFVLPEARATNLAHWNGLWWSDVRVHAVVLHDQPDATAVNVDPDENITRIPELPLPPRTVEDERFYYYPIDVYAMAASGGKLYVSGLLNRGNSRTLGVAAWDGRLWTLLDPFSPAPGGGSVYANALAAEGTNVFAAITGGDQGSFGNVLRWDGNEWSGLAGGPGVGQDGASLPPIRALVLQGTNLYVTGGALSYGGEVQNTPTNLLRWDGLAWSSVGVPIVGEGVVLALAATTNRLYAGGAFTNVSGLPVRNVARWNGSHWTQLGAGIGRSSFAANGLREYVSVMAASDGKVYFGGQFGEAGGYPTFNFAVWDENLLSFLNYYWPVIPYPSLPPVPARPPTVGTSTYQTMVRIATRPTSPGSAIAPLPPPGNPSAPPLPPAPDAVGR